MAWTRRGFLKASLAAGAASSAGRFLTSCKGTATPPQGVELRTLHFDLSGFSVNATYQLDVGVEGIPLTPHDAASLRQARRGNEFLAALPDDQLTHYVRDVPFPADAPQSFTVTRPHPADDGRRVMALAGLHVPSSGILGARRFKGADFALRSPNWYRMAANDAGLAGTSDFDHVTPEQAGLWAVFHHPEFISLDGTTAAIVANHILEARAPLERLAGIIADLGDPEPDPDSPYGGWIEARWVYALDGKTRVFRQDEQGNPVLDESGRILWEWDWFVHDRVLRAASLVITAALRAVRNDAVLVDDGSAVGEKPGRFAILPGLHADAPVEAGTNAAYTWVLDHPEWRWGQRARDVAVGDDRKLRFTADNSFYRHTGMFAAFEDVDGKILRLVDAGITPGALDYECIQYLGLLGAPERICGIPVHGDHTESGPFAVDVPRKAAAVHLLSGGLAFTDGDYRPEYHGVLVPGLAMTATFELALPAILLAAGVAGDIASGFKRSLIATMGPPVVVGVAQAAAEYGLDKRGGDGIYMGVGYQVGSFALRQLCGRTFFAMLAVAVAAAWAKKAIPFIGIGLMLADIASTVAELTETSCDLGSSVRCARTRVAVTNSLAVTVHRDPRHFEWPAEATHLRLVVACSGSRIFTYDYPFEIADHQRETWTRTLVIPTGGKVRASVVFTSARGWIAGQGFAEVPNVVPAGRADVPVDITIEENLVPLDPTTTYSHRMTIRPDASGHRRWVETHEPPFAPLSCDDVPGALCEVGALSLNDATGQIGYAFLSAGAGLGVCGSPASQGVQGWQFQNLNLRVTSRGQDPEETLTQVPCSRLQTSHLLYDLLGPADGPQFAIVPTGNVLTLRQLALPSAAGVFPDLLTAPCWGRFRTRNLRQAAFHPVSRCVLAIVDERDKVEVLRLGDAPVPASAWAEAPVADLVTGPGELPGNVGGLRAVAPLHGGRGFLALEQNNRRIQALDDHGLPIEYFTARAPGHRWWIPLRDEAGWPQYLSLSVEPVGYVYVLSSVGAASRVTDFRLDIYDPRGNWMARTTGVAAMQILVDRWRNLYALNHEALVVGGRTEPSVSEWIPSTPRSETIFRPIGSLR